MLPPKGMRDFYDLSRREIDEEAKHEQNKTMV